MPQEYVPSPEKALEKPRPKAYISDTEGKYQIIASRYIDGEVINASPEEPAIITLPAGSKIDCELVAVNDETTVKDLPKLKPAHAGNTAQKRQSAAERFGRAPQKNPNDG